jgi:hypothetical protein
MRTANGEQPHDHGERDSQFTEEEPADEVAPERSRKACDRVQNVSKAERTQRKVHEQHEDEAAQESATKPHDPFDVHRAGSFHAGWPHYLSYNLKLTIISIGSGAFTCGIASPSAFLAQKTNSPISRHSRVCKTPPPIADRERDGRVFARRMGK